MLGRDLLSFDDLSAEECVRVLDLAQLLRTPDGRERSARLLEDRTLAMIFEKPSTRTRVSFEVGMKQLGGRTIMLSGAEAQLGVREPVGDFARVLTRYVDIVMARVRFHSDLKEFASYASIPVINGLSDLFHPCQALADLLTLRDVFGTFDGLKLLYVGDGNNVCNSLIEAGALLNFKVAVACPAGYEPVVPKGVTIEMSNRWEDVIAGADAIYTDTWISMGQEEESAVRRRDFVAFRVTSGMMRASGKDPVFLHCLPAHRGEEVDAEVIEGSRSLVFEQAENRLHAQKALLALLMSEDVAGWV